MPEIPDPLFLRINQETKRVSPEVVRAAQKRQKDVSARTGSCPSLVDILRENGILNPEVMEELRELAQKEEVLKQTTPTGRTVVLHPLEAETPTPGSASSSDVSRYRSARRAPPEVEAARQNPKNLLGPFVIVKEVGRGGMGRVYRSWDGNVGRFVALKVIDTDDQDDRERFVREAQIAGRLHHPSIATIYQAGEEGTRGYIAMQFIEGAPIDGKRPIVTLLALIRDAARALSYAHEQGVVHRDVKPGNLLVDQDGLLFLTDFGLAKEVVGDEKSSKLSITGTTFGTPQYMSPEQARGEHKKVDARSDIYSLGTTLYALLAGRPPFTRPNIGALLVEVSEKRPPPLSRFNGRISPELQGVVERAMAKDMNRRFPTMAAFGEALDALLREGRFEGKFGLAKVIARRWIPVAAVAIALAAGLRFGAPALVASQRAAPGDTIGDLYRAAAVALEPLESQGGGPSQRINGVIGKLDTILARQPGHLRAISLRLRALYVKGDRQAVAAELPKLKGRKVDDYRLSLLQGLLAVENALSMPPPLPAQESLAAWDEPVAPWPAAATEALRAVLNAKVDPDLVPDYNRDRPAAEALVALAEARMETAARELKKFRMPVYRRAWFRAAYLAGFFREVREAESVAECARERLGAGLAAAAGPRELEALLPEMKADPAVEAAALAALARLDRGADPEEQVAKALGLGPSPERAAALWSARLRWQAHSGNDGESKYREAILLAGEKPATAQGRLAAIELRIGLGSRLLRARKDGRPVLEEAVKRADALTRESPAWAPPRLLRGLARLKLGQVEDARAELAALPPEARGVVRARLLASAVQLAMAERSRKAGRSFAPEAEEARGEAAAALASAPGHVEGSVLAGAAELLLAQHLMASGQDEGARLKESEVFLGAALGSCVNHVDARFHRGRVRFLRGEAAKRSGQDGRAEGEGARADLDAALRESPEFLAVLHMRGIVNYSLGRYQESLEDWRALVKADPAWQTPELKSWIEQAEGRLRK